MKKRAFVMAVSLGVGLGLLGACGSESHDSNDPTVLTLDGHTFLGSTATVDDQPDTIARASSLRLSFDDPRIAASGGCNTMSGSATWDTGTLKLDGPLASTEMACDTDLMDQDSWFADVLGSKPTLAQDHDTLTLTTGSTIVVMTDEEVVVPDQPLTGTSWQLDAISGGNSVSSVPAGASATIAFDDNGTLSAFLGCNQAHGSYEDTGDQLIFEPLATTKRACEAPASEVEQAMLSVLHGTVGYSIDGDSLALTATRVSGDSPSALQFRAEPAQPSG